MEETIFKVYPKLKACRFCKYLNMEKYTEYEHEATIYCQYDEGQIYDYDYAHTCDKFEPSYTTINLLNNFKQYINPFSILKNIGGNNNE